MGFLWSQPEQPLDHTLQESLLKSEPELIFRSGDLLITRASALQITLNQCLWSKVAIVVYKKNRVYAFSNGLCEPIETYLFNHPNTVCRPLQCIRYSGFDRRVEEAVTRTLDIMIKKYQFSIESREGYCAGTVLGILGFVDFKHLSTYFHQLRPDDFVSGGRLELQDYTVECWNVH